MSMPFLDAEREPIFADLATDPRFAEIANELLSPRSYSSRHDTAQILGVECTACTPFRIMVQAAIAEETSCQPKTVLGVVVDDSPAARRARAKEFGPKPGKRRKS